jgi:hypothetical protein
MSLRLARTVLQISGIEFIILGFVSWLAALWVHSTKPADENVPLNLLVTLADQTQALTHASPYIAPTILGIFLIALGTALRYLDANG